MSALLTVRRSPRTRKAPVAGGAVGAWCPSTFATDSHYPRVVIIDLSDIRFPTGSDEEMVFQTFSSYLEAFCTWSRDLHPHEDGLVSGVAAAVLTRPWTTSVPPRRRDLSERAGELLRNAWATEVLLNAPRILGSRDLIGFANLWAPVQAYYAVFEALTALAMTVGSSSPPKSHQAMLQWAGSRLPEANSPFVEPWTARVRAAKLLIGSMVTPAKPSQRYAAGDPSRGSRTHRTCWPRP